MGRAKVGDAGKDLAVRKKRFGRVFGSADGKKVLGDLIDYAGLDRRLWAVDGRIQDGNVARHDFGCWILEQIEGDKQ